MTLAKYLLYKVFCSEIHLDSKWAAAEGGLVIDRVRYFWQKLDFCQFLFGHSMEEPLWLDFSIPKKKVTQTELTYGHYNL